MTDPRVASNRGSAWAVAIGLFIASASSRALAQSVRGSVVDPGGQPVAGVVVMLLDQTSTVVARALSDESGQYRVRAPGAGSFRLRTLRIGYRPSTSDVFGLAGDNDVVRRLTVTGIPLALDTMRVVDRSSCRSLGDTALATFAVWEQVRAALMATELTERSRSVSATMIAYDRVLRGTTNLVRSQRSRVRTDTVAQPWTSATPLRLRQTGYVVDASDSTAYLAPGTSVLLSPEFLEDHCFRITKSSDPTRLGVEFSPTRDRHVAEIRGTLWLDRKTAELRSMDFGYVNVPAVQAAASGGAMEFARMRDGAWVISRWDIRMPVLAMVTWNGARYMHVTEVHISGGQLAIARRGTDTLWASPPLIVAGTVADSATGTAIAGARVALEGTPLATVADSSGRFQIEGVVPGEYMVDARTPSLDSIGAVSETSILVASAGEPFTIRVPGARQFAAALCRDDKIASARSLTGLVIGDVRDPTAVGAPTRTRVSAEWTHIVVHPSSANGPELQRLPHAFDTYTNEQGNFRLCGVPLGEELTIRATADSARSTPVRLTISPEVRFSRVELLLDRWLGSVAAFTGVVVADTTNQPLSGAEVALPELGMTAITNDRGVFRLTDIPSGEQVVQVRRVGYAPLDQRVQFGPNETVSKRLLLERVVLLDSVRTTASESEIPDFEEHKRLGLGHFLTRVELEQRAASHLGEVLEVFPSIQIYRPPMHPTRAYAARSRGVTSILGTGAQQGGVCLASVYVDGHAMYGKIGGDSEEPFDLNSLSPDQIEAIEYYAGPSETPAKYSGLNSTCGVLVIWLRHEP